jgi:single-stranded-DNA-specific exonuclease
MEIETENPCECRDFFWYRTMKSATERRWRIKECDPDKASAIATEASIPLALAKILSARGFTDPAAINTYLSPELSGLSDPFLLKGMDAAVTRIIRAGTTGETVCIHGDYDVDGISAVALLASFFRVIGFKACYVIPRRLEEGYGLSTEGVDEAVRLGAGLIITVDCGITSLPEADYCRKRGIDLIITDHHMPGDRVPEAVAVINPLQQGCQSPFKQLAGVGLALKLIIGIRTRMREMGLFTTVGEPNLLEYLEFAALGTIADLVPLTGENRIIAAFGLRRLTLSQRPGILALKKVSAVEGSISAGDVGFRLAPRLNASGRLDDAKRGVELLLTTDSVLAGHLAEELDAANRERQLIEKEILADALKQMGNDPTMKNRTAIVLAGEDWHPGVIGIVASRLVDLYHRPTILIAIQNGTGRGSGRSIANFHLHEALCSTAEHLIKFGGHRQAAGLEIAVVDIEDFYDSFDNYAAANLDQDDMLPEITIDAVLQPKEISLELLDAKEKMMPFGMGNPEPVFLLSDAEIVSCRILKEQHLKLSVKADGKVFDAIGFGMADRMPETGTADLAFVLEKNVWRGKESLQLRLKDIQTAGDVGGT